MAVIASLLSLVFLGLSLCPCPPSMMASPGAAASAPLASAHECCAPAAGIAAARSCCEGEGAPAARVITTASAPAIAPALAAAVAFAPAAALVPLPLVAGGFAVRPPLVLRV